jgi:hypothetical protein
MVKLAVRAAFWLSIVTWVKLLSGVLLLVIQVKVVNVFTSSHNIRKIKCALTNYLAVETYVSWMFNLFNLMMFFFIGNHESETMNQMYGFEGEVKSKYPLGVWLICFAYL